MSEFEVVGKIEDFEEGHGRAVPVDGDVDQHDGDEQAQRQPPHQAGGV